jgi:2-oxoglutarate ferredoxin oxidoreductase subunit beta
MNSAMANLDWIKEITVPKNKFEKLSDEEKVGKFPTGILKQDENAAEYTDLYEKVKTAQKNKTAVEF